MDKYVIVQDGDIFEVAEKDEAVDYLYVVVAKFYDEEAAKAYVESLKKK